MYDHYSYFGSVIFKITMGFHEAGSWQAGCSILKTSSQDGDFRLENLKNTLRDMLRYCLLLHLVVSRCWT